MACVSPGVERDGGRVKGGIEERRVSEEGRYELRKYIMLKEIGKRMRG